MHASPLTNSDRAHRSTPCWLELDPTHRNATRHDTSGRYGRSSPAAHARHTHTAQTRTHAVAYLLTYKRLQKKKCFQCQAFVSVGQEPNLKKTLMDMLSMLTNGRQVDDEDIENLILRLKETLENIRYALFT